MKNEDVCKGCPYIHVPSVFSPCLGCMGNLDHLVENKDTYEDNTSQNKDSKFAC